MEALFSARGPNAGRRGRIAQHAFGRCEEFDSIWWAKLPHFFKHERRAMVAATFQLLVELDAAEAWPAERRATVLDQTARLFLGSIENLSAHQADLFDNVFTRLIDCVDLQSLARFSQKLSESKRVLPQAGRRLALHENEAVWVPILKSQAIEQDVLVEVIQSRGLKQRLVIASRHSLEPLITDALIECDMPAVHHVLAGNLGARMSEAGWIRLARFGDNDRKLAEKLTLRAEIPPSLKRAIHVKLDDARMRALHRKPVVVRDRIEDTLASRAASATMSDPKPSELASAQAKVLELNRKGKLKDSTINRLAFDREYVDIAAALALLTGSPIDVIQALITGDRVEGLVLACKAARLTWGTTTMIVKNRPGVPAMSAEELEIAKETFESFSLSAAQRAVRF
jgi:uncharacterized protein (DUF2336 family)